MEAKNPYFVAKSCWKSSYFVYLFCPKNDAIDFTKWFHNNSAMGGRRKLPDPLLNRIFNALSIGVQYTLSFQWTNFGLKCLIIEWKHSCKFFVQLFIKSDNISLAIFRGNDITENCGAYREIPPLVPELFTYSYMSNGSLLSGNTKSSGKGIEEIYLGRNRMGRQFWRFDDSHVDLKFCDIRIISQLLNLIEGIFSNSRQILEMLSPEYFRQ